MQGWEGLSEWICPRHGACADGFPSLLPLKYDDLFIEIDGLMFTFNTFQVPLADSPVGDNGPPESRVYQGKIKKHCPEGRRTAWRRSIAIQPPSRPSRSLSLHTCLYISDVGCGRRRRRRPVAMAAAAASWGAALISPQGSVLSVSVPCLVRPPSVSPSPILCFSRRLRTAGLRYCPVTAVRTWAAAVAGHDPSPVDTITATLQCCRFSEEQCVVREGNRERATWRG